MEPTRTKVPTQTHYYIAMVILWGIYVALSLMAPTSQVLSGRYQLSSSQINLLRLSVLIPYLIIWLAALFAALRFHYYAKLVSDSKEEQGFKSLSFGLWILLITIIVPLFIALIPTYNPESVEIQKTVTIIRTYFVLALYLVAFWTILTSTENLKSILPAGANLSKRRMGVTIFIIILGIVYSWSVFQNQYRTVSNDTLIRPTYYLNDALIIPTIIVPYILIWILGSWAILNIHHFSKNVQGIVYRKAFFSINAGLIIIIGLSIFLQFLVQAAAFFGRAGLGIILLIVYPLLVVIAAGYLFIARGARALANIEEV